MDTDRSTMDSVLKRTCVPVLRQLGFKGSYPNFYRDSGGFVALVNIQFASAGGSFCINLGFADTGRSNVYSRPETAPDKLRLSQTRVRARLGAADGGDHWFVYGSASATPFRGSVQPPEELAAQCSAFLTTEAEAWWTKMQAQHG